MDQRLAEKAQRAGELGLRAQAVLVIDARVPAVDRGCQPGGPGGDNQVRARVQSVQVAVRGAEVAAQVDTAERQVADAVGERDLRRREQPASGLDRADQWRTRGT